jgi:hypothetical protein
MWPDLLTLTSTTLQSGEIERKKPPESAPLPAATTEVIMPCQLAGSTESSVPVPLGTTLW